MMLIQQRIGKNVVYAQRGILNAARQVLRVIRVKFCFVCANIVDMVLNTIAFSCDTKRKI
jgi:hypothetical protein